MKLERIATEEAFVTEDVLREWKKALASGTADPNFRSTAKTLVGDSPGIKHIDSLLLDIGAGRIAHMDKAGMDMYVLSLTSPGVQVLTADIGKALATSSNDALSEAVRKHPDRFAGLASFAPQDPAGAAKEIGRARSLGLCGLIVNSHTNGEYLDHPKFAPILEAAEAEKLPIYLHPREPSALGPFMDYGLYFAMWGFAVETGLHALRLIMSGAFDRWPGLKIVLGHMGEGIPFWLQRIDNRYLMQSKLGAGAKIRRLPSEYFQDNFVITTSGVTSHPALRLAIDVLGAERVLFAVDYPYEDADEARTFLDTADVTDEQRRMIYADNAKRVFGL